METNRVPLGDTIIASWRTSCQTTAYLVAHLPAASWNERIPGIPTGTVRTVAAHLHNSRVGWIRTLGSEHGIRPPARVDRRRVTKAQLLAALKKSAKGMEDVLRLGIANGGRVPPSKRYVWRNLPLDVGHVLSYFVAHEGHHRGQLALVTRQTGHRLPRKVTNFLWQWSTMVRQREGPRG